MFTRENTSKPIDMSKNEISTCRSAYKRAVVVSFKDHLEALAQKEELFEQSIAACSGIKDQDTKIDNYVGISESTESPGQQINHNAIAKLALQFSRLFSNQSILPVSSDEFIGVFVFQTVMLLATHDVVTVYSTNPTILSILNEQKGSLPETFGNLQVFSLHNDGRSSQET